MSDNGEKSELLEENTAQMNTGRSALGDEPATQADPVRLFGQLPGISEKLALRITKQLGVRSLEELELAAHDGRLKKLKGFGPQRVRSVKEVLAGRLNRSTRKKKKESP
jgi:DNA polymerase (family X)